MPPQLNRKRTMNIHEYQAKKILSQYGIAIPAGGIAYTPSEAKRVALSLTSRGPWMLKAQIQSGARASGHFVEREAGHKSGIRQVTKISNITYETTQMLNNTLVTEQTGAAGKLVSKVYVEAFKKVKHVFYAGIVIDCALPAVTLLISEIINQDIVKVATSDRSKILRINLKFGEELQQAQIIRVLDFLNLDKSYLPYFDDFFAKLYHTFMSLDAQMIEINPVGILRDKTLIALDAKINFDDHALFRHPDVLRMQDDYEENARTLRAKKFGFQYSEFNGNIGCIVNGDGLALEAMDLIKKQNGELACFLNVKGGVDKDKIAEGIKIIMTNPRVEGILINVLGGFMRCNLIADGILAATQEVGMNVPIILRLEGTNKEEAQDILAKSNLPIIFAKDMNDAIAVLLKQMEVND